MPKGRAVTLSFCLLLALTYACQDFTTPGHSPLWPGVRRLDFSAGPVVTVTPSDMGGWAFINDQTNTACTATTLCALVPGPAGMPIGSGSAELATLASTDGIAIARAGYAGVRLDQVTELSYSTYRQSTDAGNNLAIALQLTVDYDLTDADSSYQGRLVYEPYRAAPGGVPQGTWQRWDTRAGTWWGTRATVRKNGIAITNPCVQASPCTWAQLFGLFPDLGMHKKYGAVVLKAGSGWAAFRGNVDAVSIGVGGVTTTFDFEVGNDVPAVAPDSVPANYPDYATAIDGSAHFAAKVLPDIVILRFRNGATQAERRAAVASVNGVVIGGRRNSNGDGQYIIRVPTDGTIEPLFVAIGILTGLPQVSVAMPNAILENAPTYRRPNDGVGERRTDWHLLPDSAFGSASRRTWPLEATNAPFA